MTSPETVARQYRKLLLHIARGDEDKVQDALLYLVGHNVEDLNKAVGLAILHIKSAYKMEYRHDSVVTRSLALVAVEMEREDTTEARLAIYKALPRLQTRYRVAIETYLAGGRPGKDMLFRAKAALRDVAINLL